MTTIKLKNGSGAPAGGDLVQGEPALDLTNKRLYTEDSGGTVIEVGTNPGVDVTFADNRKAIFGAGSDLQIYHDGSDSYITDTTGGNFFINEEGAGYLMMKGSDLYFRNPDSADMIHAQSGGYVKLYHNGAQKLATTNTGIDVTGTVVSDGLTVDGSAAIDGGSSENTVLTLDSSTANTYLKITDSNSTNGVFIGAATNDLNFYPNNTLSAKFAAGGDISFYEDTGTTAKLFWDASAETLAIGLSGANARLEVGAFATTASDIAYFSNSNGAHKAIIRLDAQGDGEFVLRDAGNNEDVVITAGGDSYFNGGNLLIGKTSASVSTVGIEVRNNGFFSATRDSSTVGYFNRTTNDGEIVAFRKDNTTVGSIGTLSSALTIGTGDTGVQFNADTNAIMPHNISTGANVDASIDIGYSSGGTNRRFKDLYLSGGAYLGGTGSANKLDDYEEGTWTPLGVGLTLSSPSGTYTKVGRLVTVTWQFVYPTTTSGSQTSIAGLPFTVLTGYNNGGNHGYVNGSAAVSIAHITAVTTSILYRTANGGTALTHADLSGATIRGSMTYMTT